MPPLAILPTLLLLLSSFVAWRPYMRVLCQATNSLSARFTQASHVQAVHEAIQQSALQLSPFLDQLVPELKFRR